MKRIALLFLTLGSLTARSAELVPLEKLNPQELRERLDHDASTVQVHRRGLRSVVAYLDSRPDLFPREGTTAAMLLARADKEAVWAAWQRFLDYQLALDSIGQYHARFFRLKGPAREESFLVNYEAMLARYHAALDWIRRCENNPELDKVLNDAVPELGLPAGSYASLKFKYLNAAFATEFAAHDILFHGFNAGRQPALRDAIQEDSLAVWDAARSQGPKLTARNALEVMQSGAQACWFPIQKGVSEWMGHTKVYRPGRCLITSAQIQSLQPRLQPGDVLLERREWFLSNIGLPGFWSHAALYLGTPEERHAFFAADPTTRTLARQTGEPSGELEPLLQRAWAEREAGRLAPTVRVVPTYLLPQEQNHAVRVIEAIGEGVSFKSLEHSAACDSLAVLRPRLAKAEKAQALLRAVHYAGRPYDYNFDFSTDAELVCTELVYKSYEPAPGFKGLRFPLVEMLGRKVTPANELVKQFDAQCNTPEQQFDLVEFLDGNERLGIAKLESLEEFRASWRRPKWHLLTQP